MINFLFRIQGKIYREISKLFCYRPASYPYVSGDGFRAMANHIYDETKKCVVNEIKAGDTIFLKTDLIEEWFKDFHPKINTKYKLITHNSDGVVGEKEVSYIDDKIIHWFAQNNTFMHPKITPIPIGIENKKWYMSGWTLYKIANKLKQKNVPKKNGILFGFNHHTNTQERMQALGALRQNRFTDEIKNRLSPWQYFRKLNCYRFVASPEGNGPDCHRTWEALYIKTIPIVKNSVSMRYFNDLNLPIWVINNWSDLNKYTENDLFKKYSELIRDSNFEPLYMSYWIDKIRKN